MNDTPLEIEQRYREMLLQRSGEERLIMGRSMYASARELVVASMPDLLIRLKTDQPRYLILETKGCDPLEEVKRAAAEPFPQHTDPQRGLRK